MKKKNRPHTVSCLALATTMLLGLAFGKVDRAAASVLTVTDNLEIRLNVFNVLDAGGDPASVGEEVATWQDISGNGRDFTAIGGRRPTLVDNISHSLTPGLSFDSVDAATRGSLTLTVNSLFIAFTPDSPVDSTSSVQVLFGADGVADGTAEGYEDTLELGSHSGNFTDEVIGTRTRISTGDPGGTAQSAYTSSTATLEGFNTIGLISNGSVIDIYLNGVQVNNASLFADDNGIDIDGTMAIGARETIIDHFHGNIFEVLAYSTSLNASEIAAVESYLQGQYQIPEPSVVLLIGMGLSTIWCVYRKSGQNRSAT